MLLFKAGLDKLSLQSVFSSNQLNLCLCITDVKRKHHHVLALVPCHKEEVSTHYYYTELR